MLAPSHFPFNLTTLFNPKPRVEVVPLFDGHRCIIIDDFMNHPQALVDYASSQRSHFYYDDDNYFPGLEYGMSRDFSLAMDQYFMLHVRRHLGARRNLGLSCRLSMTTLQADKLKPLQRLCHRDAESAPDNVGIGAAVLYLFENSAMGGTSFYRPKQNLDAIRKFLKQAEQTSNEELTKLIGTTAEYMRASNSYFDLVHSIPSRWNRAIFYEGTVFHAAQIEHPELLNDDPANGRLTLNAFFQFRRHTI